MKSPERASQPPASTETAASDLAASVLHVLVAEDNPINLEVAEFNLKKLGHRVTAVTDGQAAVERVKVGDIDLVLMDLYMPSVNGFEAAAQIRQQEKLTGGHLPIIAITADSIQGVRDRCLEAGMDDFITKPFRRADLVAVMDRVSERLAQAGMGWGAKNTPRCLPPGAIKPELQARLVKLYWETTPGLRAKLCTAAANNDSSALHYAAHTLKGSVSYFGSLPSAEPAYALLAQIEALSGEGGAFEKAAALLPECERTIEAMERELAGQ